MTPLSTEQVARLAGISRVTLERWLAAGKVPKPPAVRYGGIHLRRWTARHVEGVRRYKAAHYRKGRGRKKVLKGQKEKQK